MRLLYLNTAFEKLNISARILSYLRHFAGQKPSTASLISYKTLRSTYLIFILKKYLPTPVDNLQPLHQMSQEMFVCYIIHINTL